MGWVCAFWEVYANHRELAFARLFAQTVCGSAAIGSEGKRVGVGIMIAHNPLHGSGQADFPHPALALGDDAHAAQGIGMTDGRQRQPASDEAPHAVPEDVSVLATPRQRAMPEPSHLESKKSQRRVVH